MADLSEADWKVLLGEDYKTKWLASDAAAGITDASRAAKKKADMLSNLMFTGLGFSFVALLIFGTNAYSVSGPYSPGLAMFSGIVSVAGLAVAAYAWRSNKA